MSECVIAEEYHVYSVDKFPPGGSRDPTMSGLAAKTAALGSLVAVKTCISTGVINLSDVVFGITCGDPVADANVNATYGLDRSENVETETKCPPGQISPDLPKSPVRGPGVVESYLWCLPTLKLTKGFVWIRALSGFSSPVRGIEQPRSC